MREWRVISVGKATTFADGEGTPVDCRAAFVGGFAVNGRRAVNWRVFGGAAGVGASLTAEAFLAEPSMKGLTAKKSFAAYPSSTAEP